VRAQAVIQNGLLAFVHLVGVAALLLSTQSAVSQVSSWVPNAVKVTAGEYISGSNRAERDLAYELDEAAYGHSITRTQRWYESEHEQQVRSLPEFSIMTAPVTRCDYARFLSDTDYPGPQIDQDAWDAQGLNHKYPSTIKFQWRAGEENEQERCQHPVVLVSHQDANAYAQWLSIQSGRTWRLPNEFEWEKAARGLTGNLFPWGNEYDASKLNSHDHGPFDTLPVGSFADSASPFGLLDAAGQVFEWTSTPRGKQNTNSANDKGTQRFVVKGGSWDDKGCGVCRPAARHFRDENLKHILVGFRLVTDQ